MVLVGRPVMVKIHAGQAVPTEGRWPCPDCGQMMTDQFYRGTELRWWCSHCMRSWVARREEQR